MIFYKVVFGVCLLLLCTSYAALMAAHKKGDKRQVRVFHLFRLGLGFSAISYLLRIMDSPHAGRPSFLVIITCLAGTIFIWIGWKEHWQLRWERLKAQAVARPAEEEGEEEDGLVLETLLFPGHDPSLPRLNARAPSPALCSGRGPPTTTGFCGYGTFAFGSAAGATEYRCLYPQDSGR